MKKGFTLIELLAVIVILALIALVTIPMINNVIEKAKKGALEDSVYGLKSAAELYYSTTGTSETIEFNCTKEGCINGDKKLPFKGQVHEGKVKLFSDGKVSICLTSDGYGSSILADEKKVTTAQGGCDEETYKVSEVIAIEKYKEVNEELDKVKNEFLSVKTTLNNKTIITKVENETEEINKEINNYGDGINNLVNSLYNKTVISSKENTFEEMASEVNSLDLNQGEAANKKAIVEGLQYSELGITEDMSWEEIKEVLLNAYPELPIGTTYNFAYTGGVQTWTAEATGLYKLEVYGAQGGYSGANGGYSLGYKYINKGDTLYIVIGGAGIRATSTGTFAGGYNGGGTASYSFSGSGGGATHIASITGILSSLSNNKDKILIVAGGGGGRFYYSDSYTRQGGAGGGTSGGGISYANDYTMNCTGASQNQGGVFSGTIGGSNGSFGQGGNCTSATGGFGGSGGGGGYYGGACSGYGGSGGSGYIGGVPKIEYNGKTYSPTTTNGTNTGNGKAVITYIAS